jgi:sRNA-binding protein
MQIPRPVPTRNTGNAGNAGNPGDTIALLAARFPATFSADLELVKPIAIGIRQAIQLQCPDIPPKQLRWALGLYCSHGSYLRSLIEGAPRIGLDGTPSGSVTADAAQAAAATLASREADAARQAAQAKAAFAAGRPAPHRPREAAKPQPKAPASPPVPPAPLAAPRLGLAGLKAAAAARRIGGKP